MIFNPFGVGKDSNGNVFRTFRNQNYETIKEIRAELNQLSKEANPKGVNSAGSKIKNYFKSFFTSQAQVELSVNDEQFKSRIAGDQKLIESFVSKIKEVKDGEINIGSVLNDLNINEKNHANLYNYLSTQDAESVKNLENASRLTQEYAASQDTLRIKTAGATAKLIAMKAASLALNVGLSLVISLVVSKLIQGFSSLANHTQEVIDKANELTAAWEEQRKTLRSNKSTIDNISSDYQKLSQGVDTLGRNISLTAEQYEQYNNITNQIAEMFPELVSGWTNEGNAIIRNKGSIEELTAAYEKLKKANREAVLDDADDVLKGYWEEQKKNQDYSDFLDYKRIIDSINSLGVKDEQGRFVLNKEARAELALDFKYFAKNPNLDLSEFFIKDSGSEQFFVEMDKIQSAYDSLVAELNVSTNKIKPIFTGLLDQEYEYNGGIDFDTQDVISQIVSNLEYDFFASDDIRKKTKNEIQEWIETNLILPLTDPSTSQQMKEALNSLLSFMNGDAWAEYSVGDYQAQLEALQKALPEALWEKVKVYITPEFSLTDSKQEIENKIGYALTDDEFNALTISEIQIILNPDFVFDKNSGDNLQAQIQKFIEEQQKRTAAAAYDAAISNYEEKANMASSVRSKIASGTLTAEEAKSFMKENSTYDWSEVDVITGKFDKLKDVLDEITESSYRQAMDSIDNAMTVAEEDLAQKRLELAEKLLAMKNDDGGLLDGPDEIDNINTLKTEIADLTTQIDSLGKKKQILAATHGEEMISLASDAAETATKKLDELQSAYTTVSNAIQEYNNNGSITVDTYQSIIGLAGTYLSYLIDENGKLNLTQEALRKVAAARIMESGAKSAELLLDTVSAYVDEGKSLDELTGVFNENTNAIWSNVYAKLALIEADENITEGQKASIRTQIEALKQLTEEQQNKVLNGDFSGFGSGSGSSSGEDAWLKAYEAERATLDHLYKMELIDVQQYYDGIEKLRKKYFDGRKKYLDKDRGLQEELFDLDREIAKKRISDIEYEISLLEQYEEIEKSRIDSAENAGNVDLTRFKNIENQKLEYYRKIRDEVNKQLRAAYAYGLDDHSDYVQELQKQWYDANKNMIQVYQNLLDTLESKRDNFQSQQSSMLDAYMNVLEKEKTALEEQKSKEEEYWNERIENYKKEHDEQEKTNELEEKRLKLLNIQKQKNVLMYDKDKGWIRTYDHSAYDEAKKDYDKAVADKEYNDELERLENRKQNAIDAIQSQIDGIEKLRDTYKDKFDEINDILGMTEEQLAALNDFTNMTAEERESYLEKFVSNFKSKMEEMITEINKVKDSMDWMQNGIDGAFNYSNTKPGVVSDDYRIYKDSQTGQGIMAKNSEITWRGKTPTQAQIDAWEKEGWRYAGDGGWWKNGKKYYAMGGVVEDTGMAKLHGDKVHSEVVFNAADAKKLYDYIHNTPSLILDLSKKLFGSTVPNTKAISAPVKQGTGEQNFHINQISFPNAVDGQDVVETLKELPNYFLQKKYER